MSLILSLCLYYILFALYIIYSNITQLLYACQIHIWGLLIFWASAYLYGTLSISIVIVMQPSFFTCFLSNFDVVNKKALIEIPGLPAVAYKNGA